MKRETISDYLDGLLDEAEAREVEAALARDPTLAREAERLRALLYRPYAVAAPPPLRLPGPWRGVVWSLARYAAVFVLGVLTAVLFRPARAVAEPVVAPPPTPAATYVNLRIE